MKTLVKVFFIACAMSFGLNANAVNVSAIAKKLNSQKDIETMALSLKKVFKTKEDHRQIDLFVAQYKKPAQKWRWRYEVTNNKIGMRLNGKIQFWISDLADDKKTFKLNGKPIHLKNGQSYLSMIDTLSNALKQQTALQSFLIPEAQAALFTVPFIATAAATLGFVHDQVVTPAPLRCRRDAVVDQEHPLYPLFHENRDRRFRTNQTCNVERNEHRRNRLVIQNFVSGGFDGDGVRECAHLASNPAEQQICKCTVRKMKPCNRQGRGWNLARPYADATCRIAYDTLMRCQGTPAVATPVTYAPAPGTSTTYGDPVTPCYDDKGDVIACEEPAVTPATYTPDPAPAAPATYGDPVTPCYDDKGDIIACEAPGSSD